MRSSTRLSRWRRSSSNSKPRKHGAKLPKGTPLRYLIAVSMTLFLVAVFTCSAQAARVEQSQSRISAARHAVVFYRSVTWRWQARMDATRTNSSRSERHTASLAYLHWLSRHWRSRARTARSRYELWFSSTYTKWACVHRGEGAWNSNTGNGYYGGLQMDLSFQRSYGAEFMGRFGTADRWPVYAQLIAGERAQKAGRGWYPWPQTARACGLI
jgi:hypothetical protein